MSIIKAVNSAEDCKTIKPTRIAAKAVLNIIKLMTGGKSPGYYELNIEYLQHAGSHIYAHITHCHLLDDLMKTLFIPTIKTKLVTSHKRKTTGLYP